MTFRGVNIPLETALVIAFPYFPTNTFTWMEISVVCVCVCVYVCVCVCVSVLVSLSPHAVTNAYEQKQSSVRSIVSHCCFVVHLLVFF